jgi:hypothetical protein
VKQIDAAVVPDECGAVLGEPAAGNQVVAIPEIAVKKL